MEQPVLLILGPLYKWHQGHRELGFQTMPPLGLGYIAAYLEAIDCQVRLLDMTAPLIRSEQEFRDYLKQAPPSIVGISISPLNCAPSLTLIGIIKHLLPETTVVVGGLLPSYSPEFFLADPDIDFVVRFEGELTMQELALMLRRGSGGVPGDIQGLSFRDGSGRMVHAPPRTPIQDLDAMPFPKRSLFLSCNYEMPVTVLTSRGCPLNCTYCSSAWFWGRRVRTRSPHTVVEEIAEAIDLTGTDDFFVVDDILTLSRSRTLEFCRLVRNLGPHLRWHCQGWPSALSEAILDAMYDAGCRQILFGLESADPYILSTINKTLSLDQLERCIAHATKVGFLVRLSYIIGHPEDTYSSIRRTVMFVRRMREKYGCWSQANVNIPFPGTPQYVNADELGMRFPKRDWDVYSKEASPLTETRHLSAGFFRDLKSYFAIRDGSILELIDKYESLDSPSGSAGAVAHG